MISNLTPAALRNGASPHQEVLISAEEIEAGASLAERRSSWRVRRHPERELQASELDVHPESRYRFVGLITAIRHSGPS